MTKHLLDLHCWDEMKNFVANNLLWLAIEVAYWEPCIKRRNSHYRTSPIGYWGKGSTVGWYKVLGSLYL